MGKGGEINFSSFCSYLLARVEFLPGCPCKLVEGNEWKQEKGMGLKLTFSTFFHCVKLLKFAFRELEEEEKGSQREKEKMKE